MTKIFSFPPIAANDAKVLILGSMPGRKSLEKNQYYAHVQNCFWFIIEKLFEVNSVLEYHQRLAILNNHKVALWDVLKACQRQGSLDSSIESDSIIPNDFENFLNQYSQIKHVFFNGAKAEQEYKKRVLPGLLIALKHLNYLRLPSTSPAHASMNRLEKLKQWMVVKECLISEDSQF